jgi:hypothetical protein
MLRNGSPHEPVVAGWGFDRDCIVWNAYVLVGGDIWRKTGRGRGWACSAHSSVAIALTQRYPYFWHAVGLVAAALMREKTLSGADVEALVKAANGRA